MCRLNIIIYKIVERSFVEMKVVWWLTIDEPQSNGDFMIIFTLLRLQLNGSGHKWVSLIFFSDLEDFVVSRPSRLSPDVPFAIAFRYARLRSSLDGEKT